MITVKGLSYAVCCAFLCFVLCVTNGQTQESVGDYVAPSEAVPKGAAPHMQIQLLSRGEEPKEYAVIFGEGDEAFSGLSAFAQKYHVTSAHFTAIGGLSRASLAWFDPKRDMFKKIPIDGQVEVLAMIGDIALYQGKPVVHMHMVVGSSDGTTRGGHVLAAYVFPTLEVMVTVDPIAMQKRLDPENGLTLIDPALK
jgi:predicted DNA-binding protein with PD1-like motif